MENVIIISKIDGFYAVSEPNQSHIRATLDEAMALIRDLVEKDVPEPKTDAPQGPAWVVDVLKENL